MTVSANRWIARQVIPDMIRMGMKRTPALSFLQDLGVGVRKTDFLSDWREKEGVERKRDPLQAIPKKLRPTEATIERTEYTQRKKFNYNYKIEGYDFITQEDTETWITVGSDDIMSMEEAEREAERLVDKYKIDIEIAKMIIDGVTVSK